MDNMLYIIVGLVVILLVAVLVLRKNKAKQPTTQHLDKTNKNVDAHASTSKPKTATIDSKQVPAQQNATKFDPLTVAQRFIDQQRYDKAIETLERGLTEKPQDSELLHKLLNIHATLNQHDDFNKTYNTIKLSGDAVAIDNADKLKVLLDQEQTQNQPVKPESDNEAAFKGIDFDLSTSQTVTDVESNTNKDSLDNTEAFSEALSLQPKVSETDYSSDDNFDLTLADLESTDVETNDLNANSYETTVDDNDVSAFDITEETSDEKTSTQPVTIDDVDKDQNVNNINVDDDFMLDFDLMTDDSSSSELEFNGTQTQDNQSQDVSSDDEFVLDFDDLVEETDTTTNQEDNTQPTNDDFGLLLEDEDSLAITDDLVVEDSLVVEDTTLVTNSLDTQENLNENAQVSGNDAVDSFAGLGTTDSSDEPVVNEDTQLELAATHEVIDDSTDESIDDTPSIDDEFDFDEVATLPTAVTPVENENDISLTNDHNVDIQNDTTLAASDSDFAAQFATDFDFVQTLDSSQVTLDLAGQYLQLGEYDSAKRLLNEVVTQGNSEQQNQAREMLARTA
ncbi:FimV/HubP family polar landmark protein [Psychrobacter sp. ENNN9_III]|uniref:FimV/HubP family polar landmark protein n=1 Tax=Psychrobacter sp. ENNN9_III TaxID=1254334 RepID=UPI00071E74F4|nr:FimV/HubP family polar landmark protein [Psychrobacter sp. ENNN9_III]